MQKNPHVRNFFRPRFWGLEMAAPILWAPGISWFFLLENPHAHNIPLLGGGGVLGFFRRGGGGSADFIFMAAGMFLIYGMFSRPLSFPTPLCRSLMCGAEKA